MAGHARSARVSSDRRPASSSDRHRSTCCECCAPIWERIPETASRLRQRIEAVLDAARVKGWRTGENPARWKGHLAGESAAAEEGQAGPAPTCARLAGDGRVHGGSWQSARALRRKRSASSILTAARTGEVRGMRWREVDLDAKVWTVPGDRMKAGKTHRVPLSPAAMAVLAEVRPLMKHSGRSGVPERAARMSRCPTWRCRKWCAG